MTSEAVKNYCLALEALSRIQPPNTVLHHLMDVRSLLTHAIREAREEYGNPVTTSRTDFDDEIPF